MELFFGFNEEGAVVNFEDLADDGAGIFRRAEGLHMVVAAVDKVVGCSAVESVLERGLKVKFDFSVALSFEVRVLFQPSIKFSTIESSRVLDVSQVLVSAFNLEAANAGGNEGV